MTVRLFVGNLPYDVTESELRELFAQVGQPSFVRVPNDRETGKPRGFAFVEFADRAEAEEAIRRFNQQMFKGRPLAVNEARARDEVREPRPRPPARPQWSGMPAPPDEAPQAGQARGTFGPEPRTRGKRKTEVRGQKEERAPKGPLRERSSGQLFYGTDDERDDAETLDDFALWAREDGKRDEDE